MDGEGVRAKLDFVDGPGWKWPYFAALVAALMALGGCTTSSTGQSTAGDSANLETKSGFDARWTDYRGYLDELVRKVEQQWHLILKGSRRSPPRGSGVTITFKINARGETDILQVDEAGCGKQGVWAATNAIQYSEPYGKWSDTMIAVLGNEQTLVFSFNYR